MAVFRDVNATLNEEQLDAAGFLPVSQRTIIGNYVQDKDNLPLLIDRDGTGSQVWANGVTTMTVAAGQYAIAQTRICHPYVSSHPSVYDATFARFELETNTRKEIFFGRRLTVSPYGYRDGILLVADGVAGTHKIIIIKGGTVLETIDRASWDDPLTGSGRSKINYDFTNFTFFQVDFLYLGGTGIRFYLRYGSRMILFHTYKHAGFKASTFVNSPYFKISWKIESTTGTGTFLQVCASFSILGGNEIVGKEIAIDNGSTWVNANAIGTEYLMLAIRLQAAKTNAYILPSAISTLSATNDNYMIRLHMNPTIAGALAYNAIPNTSAEYAVGSTANTVTFTNAPLASYYAVQSQEQLIQRAFLAALGSNLTGAADVLALSTVPLGANLDLFAALNLIEI